MGSIEETTLIEPLHVLDLPKIYEKPTYEVLVGVLERLKVKPSSWNGQEQAESHDDTKAISGYLSTIISSALKWFSKDVDEHVAMERREKVWDDASKRIAERCGRSAMPEMTRLWTIPASTNCPELQLKIREPPLTGDNLGHKTWGTAFTMAKQLDWLGSTHLSDVPSGGKVLELGSGTGLVGLAAAAIWCCAVTLTDLPEICSNLEANIEENKSLIWSRSGHAQHEELDWKKMQSGLIRYEVVIAADSLYDDEHPQLVANMIAHYQKCNTTSRAIVAVPLRDEHTERLAKKLQTALEAHDFDLVVDGERTCYDDWQEQGQSEGVRCWWGVFSRSRCRTIDVCAACELYARIGEL